MEDFLRIMCECYGNELIFEGRETINGRVRVKTDPLTLMVKGSHSGYRAGEWRLLEGDLDRIIEYLQAVKKEWNEQRD